MFQTKTFLMSQPTISNDLCRKTLLSRFLIILTSQFTAQAIASKVERYSFHAIIVPTKRWLLYLGPLLTYTHTHTQTLSLSLSLSLSLARSRTLTYTYTRKIQFEQVSSYEERKWVKPKLCLQNNLLSSQNKIVGNYNKR